MRMGFSGRTSGLGIRADGKGQQAVYMGHDFLRIVFALSAAEACRGLAQKAAPWRKPYVRPVHRLPLRVQHVRISQPAQGVLFFHGHAKGLELCRIKVHGGYPAGAVHSGAFCFGRETGCVPATARNGAAKGLPQAVEGLGRTSRIFIRSGDVERERKYGLPVLCGKLTACVPARFPFDKDGSKGGGTDVVLAHENSVSGAACYGFRRAGM
jgi:hypothetical protein